MAHIHVLAHLSVTTGKAKIWARNEDNGRVCYGALSDSTRDLYTEQSKITVQARERQGYVKILCVADESFGTLDDSFLKDIVGGVARGLMGIEPNPSDPLEDPMEAMIVGRINKKGINLAKLSFMPTFTVRKPLIMIRSLSAFNDGDVFFNDNDTFLAPTPARQIAAAVTAVDSTWNF